MPEIEAKLKAGQLDEAVELYGTIMELTYIKAFQNSYLFHLALPNMKGMT